MSGFLLVVAALHVVFTASCSVAHASIVETGVRSCRPVNG
jgi:hypothetical protein